MKISYGVSNLRRIKSMDPVELRPITILVGRNSADKSTFLRSLPLIRQSLQTRSSAPILWYGDYVDFGDIRQASYGASDKPEVGFRFKIDQVAEEPNGYDRLLRPFLIWSSRHSFSGTKLPSSIDVSFKVGAIESRTILKEIEMNIATAGKAANLAIRHQTGNQYNLFLGEDNVMSFFPDFELSLFEKNLFVSLQFVEKDPERSSVRGRDNPVEIIETRIFSDLLKLAPSKYRENDGRRLIELLRKTTNSKENSPIRHGLGSHFLLAFENEFGRQDDNIRSQITLFESAAQALKTLDVTSVILSTFIENMAYLGPARARSERFYRHQELEVAEIAPDGQNFPFRVLLGRVGFHGGSVAGF